MKLVVTADTHLSETGHLPASLKDELGMADLIIHAGDWMSSEVYDELAKYSDVKGVYGNADGEDICTLFPAQQRFQAAGFEIGVVHGHGKKKTTEKRVIEVFSDSPPDILIFGHSHIPMIRYFKNQLMLNPGSPTYKRKLPYYSFAVLELQENIHAELMFFS